MVKNQTSSTNQMDWLKKLNFCHKSKFCIKKNVKNDKLFATRIPDPDTSTSRQAANTLYQLSRKEAPRHALVENHELIPAIVKVLTTNEDPETVKALAGTLTAISGSPKGLLSIFKSGGIPALIKMLSSPIDKVIHSLK